jgi:hypothetical protein
MRHGLIHGLERNLMIEIIWIVELRIRFHASAPLDAVCPPGEIDAPNGLAGF